MLHCATVTRLVIAIDGPSGAGKGTLARGLAETLGYRHIDTGAMYRAVAWRASALGLALTDDAHVSTLAERAALDVEGGRVTIDGEDVTRIIRTPAVDQAAATVARLPGVRAVLVARQRALGVHGGVVMEGRDIGTVVFPEADVKVYLDASPEERARRRATDAAHGAGATTDVAVVATALADRDRSDSTRAVAPLTLAPDAIYLDTTGLSVEAVMARVLELVRARESQRR